jgi:hypothetical protein
LVTALAQSQAFPPQSCPPLMVNIDVDY